MDDPLGFSAMSPISREPEIQGELLLVISLSSPLNKGEHPSTVSLVTSPGNINSFVDMLFGSKTPKLQSAVILLNNQSLLEDSRINCKR